MPCKYKDLLTAIIFKAWHIHNVMQRSEQFKIFIMESYSERIDREIAETEKMFPDVKKIVDEISRIKNMSNMEFDYDSDRKHLMYEAVKKILNCA
jgi:hypothetical protein